MLLFIFDHSQPIRSQNIYLLRAIINHSGGFFLQIAPKRIHNGQKTEKKHTEKMVAKQIVSRYDYYCMR